MDKTLTLKFDEADGFNYFDQINFNSLLEYELAKKSIQGKGIVQKDLPFRKHVTQRMIARKFKEFSKKSQNHQCRANGVNDPEKQISIL